MHMNLFRFTRLINAVFNITVPAVQPPITGQMRKFPDVEKPTERIPEIPIGKLMRFLFSLVLKGVLIYIIVRNASSDIPYRNAPPNLQEITNKGWFLFQSFQFARCVLCVYVTAPTTGVVQAAVKKIEETTKQENDTANGMYCMLRFESFSKMHITFSFF